MCVVHEDCSSSSLLVTVVMVTREEKRGERARENVVRRKDECCWLVGVHVVFLSDFKQSLVEASVSNSDQRKENFA